MNVCPNEIEVSSSGKDVPLEGLRGLAALVVLFWHTSLAFMPELSGLFNDVGSLGVRGTPIFFMINGSAAVYLFFVLSGYVLTRNFFLTGDVSLMARGILKRWPRLMLPVLLVVLLSCLFFKLDFYRFSDAAVISKSPWLEKFGFAYTTPFDPVWSDAFFQGFFRIFFLPNNSYYDSSLWTMRPELIGSLVVMSAAPIILTMKKISKSCAVYFVLLGLLVTHYGYNEIAGFWIGALLALFIGETRSGDVFKGFMLTIVGLYLLGYSGDGIWYAPVNAISPNTSYVWIAGASALIYAFQRYNYLRNILSGRVSIFLGEISFPLYLLHVLVICSLGSFVFVEHGKAVAICSTVIVSVAASIPLAFINNKWVVLVNRATARISCK